MQKYFFQVEQRNILVDDMFQYRFVLYYALHTGQLKTREYGKWTTSCNKARREGIEEVKRRHEEIEEQNRKADEYQKEWERLYSNPKD